MDLSKNYYAILKLTKEATSDEIKTAYRRLAHKIHPDKNPDQNAKDNFQKIQDAYQILSDSAERQTYDTNSSFGKNHQAFKFNVFGNRSGYEEQLNINTEVEIALKDIYTNTSKIFSYTRNVICDNCKGNGFEPNDNWSDCLFCDGKGKSDVGQKCKYCKGAGKLYRNQCTKCKGEKVISKEETITVNNIYLVQNHKTIRYANFGHYSRYFDNKIGELIVFLKTKENKKFERKVDDLYLDIDTHFADLITGGSIEILLLDDSKYSVKIPEKTTNSQIFKIKKKGFIKKNKQRADLFIKVNVILDYNRISKELINFLNGKNN